MMSEPFLAEIRIVGFNFAPRGWASCDGQILPINQNQSLYSLLGATYGGDGRTNFALPDLRGRAAMHEGPEKPLGQRSGEETHSLTVAEMPNHGHYQAAGLAANTSSPTGKTLGNRAGRRGKRIYTDAGAIPGTNVGTGAAHENMQPFLTLRFVIALQGIFPSRN